MQLIFNGIDSQQKVAVQVPLTHVKKQDKTKTNIPPTKNVPGREAKNFPQCVTYFCSYKLLTMLST